MRKAILTLLEALFRVLFEYDCLGEEKVPAKGPAVVASNHPSYLDPVLLSLQLRRPIHFMAWDALFRVPLLGPLIRLFGAFPVDVRPGQGRAAYAQAKALIHAGELVGLFPEGKRSRAGWMEPALREGAARLAWETDVPLIPATITGAFRAWPYFSVLPRPARILVRYHEPIHPASYRTLPEEEAITALLGELRRRVDRALLPGVKADLRVNVLYQMAAPWPRWYESLPALGLALLVFWKTRSFVAVAPPYAYIGYLLADLLFIPQRRVVKWVRNASSVFFCMLYGAHVLPLVGLPPVAAAGALFAVMLGSFFPYFYELGRRRDGFIRGMVVACLIELGALHLVPTGLGPQVALPVFAAAYGWERRTVFWRYVVPALILYAAVVPRMLGGGMELLPHLVAGLVAWMLARFAPTRPTATPEKSEPPPSMLGLDLRD
jgi:1-acyl-sn-glycerol-3-phosphate acyltransferase